MAGTWCDGGSYPSNYKRIRNMRAYEEGVQARIASGSPQMPPFAPGSEQEKCWDQGEFDADPTNDSVAECSAYRGQTGPV
jgi:ribosome modulation factor